MEMPHRKQHDRAPNLGCHLTQDGMRSASGRGDGAPVAKARRLVGIPGARPPGCLPRQERPKRSKLAFRSARRLPTWPLPPGNILRGLITTGCSRHGPSPVLQHGHSDAVGFRSLRTRTYELGA